MAKLPPPPPPKPSEPPKRPPAAEVAALWAACVPVLDDPEVADWLASRKIDAGDVDLFDLARALPRSVKAPSWARFNGKAWNKAQQGFRVLTPMFDAAGNIASLHARALTPQAENGSDKAAAPADASVSGLVFANGLGRLMLAGGKLADGTSAAELVASVGLWVAEGEPDFWTVATHWHDANELAPAVLGVISGSWRESNADLAVRVPDGCKVTLGTDEDRAGHKYREGIEATLADRWRAGRVSVDYWKHPQKEG